MKMFKTVTAIFFCILMVSNSNLNAQRSFMSIDYRDIIPITDLVVNDIIGDDNKITYTASFSILMRQGDNIKNILSGLQSFAGRQFSSIIISRASIENRLAEERIYQSGTIEVLNLAELDATSKDMLRVQVELKANQMSVQQGSGQAIALANTKVKPVLASNFQFELGKLPARRVSNVSGLNFKGGNQPVDFTIELSGADAKEWHAWLQQNGRGQTRKEQGRLLLMAPDFKEVLYDINLQDVIITSYSYQINDNDAAQNPDAQATIKKVTIGLRASTVLINAAK